MMITYIINIINKFFKCFEKNLSYERERERREGKRDVTYNLIILRKISPNQFNHIYILHGVILHVYISLQIK